MSNLPGLPVLLPLVTAVLLLALHGRPARQRPIAMASGLLLLAVSGWLFLRAASGEILVLTLGGWHPAVGIAWVVDLLSGVMLLLTAITSLAVLVYAPAGLRERGEAAHFYPLHQLLLVGVNGSFLTGDFFNLFVFFEVMLLSSFALISLGGGNRRLGGAVPYVLVNLVASALFLAGVGAIYGLGGSVNMAVLARRLAEGSLPPAFPAAVALVLVVFSLKTALAPLFMWLPDSYPQAPLPVSALFAGLLTKVGVYALFRTVPLLAVGGRGTMHDVLLYVAATTMLVGVLGALGRSRIRDILSFHIVSQVGYMIFGLAVYTPLAVAGGIYYVVHHIVVKTALFLAGGMAERLGSPGAAGIAGTHPWVAVAFFVPAMALAGLPPLSGFWGKLFLIAGGFQAGFPAATTVALVVGLLTLASMLKIWVSVFWGDASAAPEPSTRADRGMLGATLALATLSVAIGLGAAPLFTVSIRAADQLLATRPYVEAVLQAHGGAGAGLALDPERP